MKFKENEFIYKKGLVAEGLFIVKSGSVSLSLEESAGAIVFKQVKEGGYLELSNSMSSKPFDFNAFTTEPTEVNYIPLQSLNDFVSANPIKTIDMLALLTEELEELNEKLLNQNKENAYYNTSKSVNIEKVDERIEIKSDRTYYKKLPADHYLHLFDKDVQCPVCEINFKVNQIKFSRLELHECKKDFRKIYKDIDELWYQLWRCPNCHYTNFATDYFKINNLVRAELKLSLPRHKMNHELVMVKDNIQQVFADIYQMNVILNIITKSSFAKARLWQAYAWLLEDVHDLDTAAEARKVLMSYLMDGWFNSTTTLDPNDEMKLAIKLSMLCAEFGDIKNAKNFILQAVRIKNVSKQLIQQAQDLMYEIKKL